MPTTSRISWGLVIGLLFLGSLAWGQKPKTGKPRERVLLKMEQDYLAPLDGPAAPLKPGMKATLWLQTGKKADGEITELVAGRLPGTLKQIALQANGKKQRLDTAAVTRIESEGKIFDVLFDAEKKAQVLLDNAKRDQVVSTRLRAARRELWSELSDQDQDAAVADLKDFLKKVEAAFPHLKFTLHETQFFLFLTDIPPNQIGGYIVNLDDMNEQLCGLFGIPSRRNVWRGKAVVVAFLNQNDFLNFEQQFFNADGTGKHGICHSHSTGRVVTACHRGADPVAFASMLVHETSHGFVHRFRSNVPIPSWINEGIADWISAAVVPSKSVPRKQQMAAERMRATGSLDGTFESNGLAFGGQNGWQYGAASGLTDFLIHRDPTLYRAFLTSIKEGRAWEDSLGDIYGMSRADLARTFGRSLGIPNLQP